MEKSVSTGLKVWLWIIIVLNGLSAVGSLFSIGNAPLSSILSVVLNAVMVYACIMILFQMKKLGFKLMCIIAVVNAIVSIVMTLVIGAAAGAAAGSTALGIAGGIVGAVFIIISAAIVPGVTYLLMKKDWAMFE